MVARKFDPGRAAVSFPWRDTQDIREEIERVCPRTRELRSCEKRAINSSTAARACWSTAA